MVETYNLNYPVMLGEYYCVWIIEGVCDIAQVFEYKTTRMYTS